MLSDQSSSSFVIFVRWAHCHSRHSPPSASLTPKHASPQTTNPSVSPSPHSLPPPKHILCPSESTHYHCTSPTCLSTSVWSCDRNPLCSGKGTTEGRRSRKRERARCENDNNYGRSWNRGQREFQRYAHPFPLCNGNDIHHVDFPVANVTQLLALIPAAGPWRKKLIEASVKWTQAHGQCPSGDPHLQQYIGEMYYKGRVS